MRRDIEIADARAIGQRERDRRLLPALAAARFQNVRDGAGAEGIALERAGDGGAEFVRAIVVEQGQQAGGVDAQRFAAGGQALQQGGDRRDREPQPVARTRRIRLARGGDQAGDMRRLLNRLPGVVAAGMARDLVGAGDQADRGRRSRAASAGGGTWVCGIE